MDKQKYDPVEEFGKELREQIEWLKLAKEENELWEHRLFVTAKDVLCAYIAYNQNPFISQGEIKSCINIADTFIEEFKKNKQQ